MKTKFNRHFLLYATTALCAAAWGEAAFGQAASSSAVLDLGSVTATAGSVASGNVAPSATGTQAQAIRQQKLAPNIISVQPASVMRKLPDANVAENLQHVPGVSMESDSGFGRFINIRGLAEDLNATQYAGINLPATNTNANPDGGNRATSLDFLPPGVIGGAEVIDSLTPDMWATGLGGVVNLLPPALSADGKPMLDITTVGGYSNLEGHGSFQGNIQAGARFAIPSMISLPNSKPFGAVFSYGYINSSPGIFDQEESYSNPTTVGTPALLNNLQLRHYDNNRITQGYTGELDFDPDTTTHFFLRGLYSADNETIQKNELYLQNLDGSAGGTVTDNGNNNFTATGANLNKFYENSGERVGLGFLEGGGSMVLDDLVTVNFHSAYTEGFDQFDKNFVSNFASNDQNLTINYDTANTTARSYTIQTASGAPYNAADPANYTFTNLTNQPYHSTDKIYDNGIDGSIPTAFLGGLGNFDAGFNVSLRARNSLQDNLSATPVNGAFPLSDVTGGEQTETDYGLYPVGPKMNYGALLSTPYIWAPQSLSNALAYQHDQENIYAGFGQETMQFGKLGVLAGLRVEATDAAYTAYGSSTDASGNTTMNATPTTNTQNYVNFFPSVQLKYELTKQLQARFAFSTGIARPGFQQINPAVSTTIQGGQGGRDLVVTGNPNLRPQTGRSYDLVLSYYPSTDNVLEADAFYKTFDNYIVGRNINTATTTFQTYENISGATARGIMLEAIQHFHLLPAPLDGLGINANLTYVDATANVHQGQGRSALPQSSPLTFNVSEMYQKGPFDFSLAESYVSRNLYSVGSDPSTDVFSQPRFRLDLDLSYQVTPHVQFFFQGRNLTNTVLEFTQSSSSQFPIQREYYGQDFLFGVHYHL
ncbi:MAG: TonB-dependent receptor [Rhodospirillales bacterium]|nr:TonB-dependent receptor [Rhodospirillales bacterium]